MPEGVIGTCKCKQIVSSINEVGLIEHLFVLQAESRKPEYLVINGHLRLMALMERDMSVGPYQIAKDHETFRYNHQNNRLSTIGTHNMICRDIDRGESKQRLPREFNDNLSSISRRINLLKGIFPEAVNLRGTQYTRDITRILRIMKAARQVGAVELMNTTNAITVLVHAEAPLNATTPEQRIDVKPAKRKKKTAPMEQIESWGKR